MQKERKERIKRFINEKSYHPLSFTELVVSLDVPKEDRELFKQCLDELEEEGAIFKSKRNRYGATDRMGLVAGKFQSHERGFGFVLPNDTNQSDIFIQSDSVNGTMHGDSVIARVTKSSSQSKNSEGEIVKILARANETIVGVFEKSNSVGYVIPDHKKIKGHIIIPVEKSMEAKQNQKVVVKITKYPEAERNAEGEIIEILGDINEKGVDILSILKTYNIPIEFPDQVIKYVESLPQELTNADYNGRKDLRSIVMVTIDGEDARDLDDAISLEIIEGDNYRLGVHIADVSNYVKENSPLDKEALRRGNSVYFPDKVIPMLPPELSNGICSLNANVDRLAFSVIMDIDKLGRVINHEIVESVINVNERMTYTDVYKILETKEEELITKYQSLVPMFENMRDLAEILMKKRSLRGAIDFDFDETRIIVDEQGEIVALERYEITIANKIIEEFMLLCNETVSEHFYWANIPFVYRIHEDPDPEKIQSLNEFLFNFGQRIKGSNNTIHPRALQTVLEKVNGTPQERVISIMMLRSLQKARYSNEHIWHFGLAASYYSHFTAPIRRYSDLIIHRIMKEYINGKLNDKRNEYYSAILPEIAKQCSEREKNAEEAERDYEDLKKTEYMKKYIGGSFSGVVSSITSFGMFVELENTVEGLIRLSSMHDDYYNYNEKLYCLVGERTGKTYRIGDAINVLLTNATPETRQIDFAPMYDAEVEVKDYYNDILHFNSKNTKKDGNSQKEYHSKKGKAKRPSKSIDKQVLANVKGKGKKKKR
ncbi:MAG TPA: ribonuclease R [Thermoclostridium sp.]|nr:ribonuclease R [Thermoclostridium sp.]